MILTKLRVDPHELEARTGWAVKPQGACLGAECVPLPPQARPGDDGLLDAAAFAAHMGMPLVADEASGLWSLGPAAGPRRNVLTTAAMPEVVLSDLRTGEDFALSSLRGQKVLLLAWASW